MRTRSNPISGAHRLGFLLSALAISIVFWSGDILPFQDYAGNLTYAAILHYRDDASSVLAATYDTAGFFHPNSLLFFAWSWLANGFGFVVAGKILLTFYALALPFSVAHLLAAADRPVSWAYFVIPLTLNYNLLMGFVGFATSVPLLFWTVARWLRFSKTLTRMDGLVTALLAYLTFLGHAQAYLVLGLVAITLCLLRARSFREFFALACPFAVSLVGAIPWIYQEFVVPADRSSLGGSPLQPFFPGMGEKLARMGEYAISGWPAAFDDVVLVGLIFVAFGGLLVRKPPLGASLRDMPLEVVSLMLWAAYFLLPEHTGVQAAIASRLVPVALMVGTGWLYMPRRLVGRIALVVSMQALTLTMAWGATKAVQKFNAEEVGDGFLELVDSLPRGSRLAFIPEPPSSGSIEVLAHGHLYGYHVALNEGIAYSGFHQYAGRHAVWRPGRHVPWPGRSLREFESSGASCYYEYLLVRNARPRAKPGRPDYAVLLGESGGYSMWHINNSAIPRCRFGFGE